MLVDTDILVDASRKDAKALAFLDSVTRHGGVAISVVSQMELMVGCRNRKEQAIVDGFLQRFEMVYLTDGISRRAVELLREYRLSHGLLIPDALIAATAIVLRVPLATKNTRHFGFMEDLELADY